MREIKNEYRLDLKLSESELDSLVSLDPNAVKQKILDMLVKQNSEVIKAKAPEIREYIAKNIIKPLEERLGMSGLPAPEVAVSKIRPVFAFRSEKEKGTIYANPLAVMEWIKGTSYDRSLRHEYGHFLSHLFNQESVANEIKINLRFDKMYGKGSFLKGNLAQTEGFAEWLAGEDKNRVRAYDSLTKGYADAKKTSEWKGVRFLRQVFDSPYAFGSIVYELAFKIGGVDEVKRLAFEKIRSSDEMKELYTGYCEKLGLEPMVAPRRRTTLSNTYKDMVAYKAAPKDESLKAALHEVDQEMRKQYESGKEPKILQLLDMSIVSDIVAESYWNHGILTMRAPTEDHMKLNQENIKGGDMVSAIAELEKSKWTIVIDSGGHSQLMRDICRKEGIAYFCISSEIPSRMSQEKQ